MTKKKTPKNDLADGQPATIMPMSLVNYHVFRWICYGDLVDVDALIQEAFDTTEDCPFYRGEEQTIAHFAKTRLSELLDDLLTDWQEEWVTQYVDSTFWTAEETEMFLDPDSDSKGSFDLSDLFVPLATASWSQVNSSTLAEAILRWKGKWEKRSRPVAI